MKITKRQLRRIIREAEGSTKKYDDDSALKGDQSKLPDGLQKGIIDKTVEDREEREEEEREEKNESMRITRLQLRRLIREALLLEQIDSSLPGDTHGGYMVPEFETLEDMKLFIDELDPDDTVIDDVYDPESGEIWIEAGFSPREAGLVEEEPEEEADPKDPWEEDELDHYDWDAYDRKMEQDREARRKLDEEMQEKIRQDAIAGGKDWGADTLYQARANSSMWQDKNSYQQWDSPEDYVLSFGQDAAGDVAQSLEYTFDSNEMHDWYNSLPTREPAYYSDEAGRPTKQTMKDIYADYFYDGVSQAVKAA